MAGPAQAVVVENGTEGQATEEVVCLRLSAAARLARTRSRGPSRRAVASE